jgi:DNA-binding FrmR family transcriptional regulator
VQADPKTVTSLLKTARGQIDGILKMVEENRYCIDISNQLTATEAVLRRANREVLKAHLEGCLKTAAHEGTADDKIDELAAVVERLMK